MGMRDNVYSQDNQGTITRSAEVYVCPACHEGVRGYFKYRFVEHQGGAQGPQPPVGVNGELRIVGGIVPQHDCIPRETRGGETRANTAPRR